jgi:hypothetical protein
MTALTLDLDLALDPPDVVAMAAGDAASGGVESRGGAGDAAPRAAAERGRVTLDEVVVGAWEGLAAHHAAACPVCRGEMRPRYGSGAAPVGGRCSGCGSTLG